MTQIVTRIDYSPDLDRQEPMPVTSAGRARKAAAVLGAPPPGQIDPEYGYWDLEWPDAMAAAAAKFGIALYIELGPYSFRIEMDPT